MEKKLSKHTPELAALLISRSMACEPCPYFLLLLL
jgi:hypothetical protein